MKIPPPGRILAGFHVTVEGQGTPVVVLEAGIAASSLSWSLVQKNIAAFTTVLSYDRRGYGWSDRPIDARTVANAASDLEEMLANTGLPGPFVLVGHSLGGLIVRVLQQKSPSQVAGMVLVDPVVRAEWQNPLKHPMIARGATLSRRGALLARLGFVGLAIRLLTGGSHRVPKLLARLSAGNGAGVASRLVGEVRKMPREQWPAIAQHWSHPQSFETMADYLEQLPLSVTQLEAERPLGDMPLVVLSASQSVPEHLHDAALSNRGRHIVVPESGHWMQLDSPDAVIEAVRQVVEEVRAK